MRILPVLVLISILASHVLSNNLGKGILFSRRKNILITGSKWTITLDVNTAEYRSVVEIFLNTVSTIQTLGGVGINNTYIKEINQLILSEKETLIKQGQRTKLQLDVVLHTLDSHVHANYRKKRGLFDGIGIAMRYVFGTATHEEVSHADKLIANLQEKNQAMAHLLADEITYINDSHYTSLQNSSDIVTLATSYGSLDKKIEEAKVSILNKTNTLEFFLSSAFHIQSAFRAMENTIAVINEDLDRLENALALAAAGKLAPYFISP